MTYPFLDLAKTVAVAENVTNACFIAVPHPMGMIFPSEVKKKAEVSFEEILEMAIDWQPSSEVTPNKPAYPAERFELTGTVEEVNKYFLAKEWSLGLPILPPTPERVIEMLRGTRRKPDEVLGLIPPRMGALTVELAAAHAVMAGCKPEYMPVLIAAVEGLLVPEVNWRGSLATTGTTQFVVIVNGPCVKEVGIGYGQGAAGKGHHANGAIGYAINLIAYTVGGSKPPSIDKSTLASPSDYVCWVFGENEGALPSGWEPLHVQRGFKRSDSAVTVMCTYPPIENIDHWSATPEEHLRWWHYIITPLHGVGGPASTVAMKQNPIVAIGPEHAQLIASAGWTEKKFRQAFWEQTRIPLSAWPDGCPGFKVLRETFGPVSPDTLIPITLKPEQFLIAIAGGDGKHSHYFPPFPGSHVGSKLVMQ